MKHAAILIIIALCLFWGCKGQTDNQTDGLLVLKEQGSFSVGGTIIQNPGTYDANKFDNFKPYPDGQTFHGDHAYVFYQIPDNSRKYPLVFLHGAGQSARTWETTADGR